VARFLADSSIWGWANSGRRPDVTAALADRFERGQVVTCAPVVLEALHRARSGDEHETLFASLFEPLDMLPLNEAAAGRALVVQRELSHTSHGNHLRPAADYLIAAIAEAAGPEVVLWSFDKDLRVICEHTRQPHEAVGAA
jgi:predicted nucleic acid-binding protein